MILEDLTEFQQHYSVALFSAALLLNCLGKRRGSRRKPDVDVHAEGKLSGGRQTLTVPFDQFFELVLERIAELGHVLEADHFFECVRAR